MNHKTSSMVLLALGALLLFASLLADVIGVGDDAGFGRQQTMGTVAGILVLAVGAYLHRKGGSSGATNDEVGGPDIE